MKFLIHVSISNTTIVLNPLLQEIVDGGTVKLPNPVV